MPVAVSSSVVWPGLGQVQAPWTSFGSLSLLEGLPPCSLWQCAPQHSNSHWQDFPPAVSRAAAQTGGCYPVLTWKPHIPLLQPASGGCSTLRELMSGFIILYFLWFVLNFWAPGPDCVLRRPQAKFCFQLQCSCSAGIALTFTAVFWINTVVIKGRIWIIAFFPCHPKKKQVNRSASQCIRWGILKKHRALTDKKRMPKAR